MKKAQLEHARRACHHYQRRVVSLKRARRWHPDDDPARHEADARYHDREMHRYLRAANIVNITQALRLLSDNQVTPVRKNPREP